jgi:hypothetical protein
VDVLLFDCDWLCFCVWLELALLLEALFALLLAALFDAEVFVLVFVIAAPVAVGCVDGGTTLHSYN